MLLNCKWASVFSLLHFLWGLTLGYEIKHRLLKVACRVIWICANLPFEGSATPSPISPFLINFHWSLKTQFINIKYLLKKQKQQKSSNILLMFSSWSLFLSLNYFVSVKIKWNIISVLESLTVGFCSVDFFLILGFSSLKVIDLFTMSYKLYHLWYF